MFGSDMTLLSGDDKLNINICIGTNCFIKGSQKLLRRLIDYVDENNLAHLVNINADFCMEACDNGPGVRVGSKKYLHATYEMIVEAIQSELSSGGVQADSAHVCSRISAQVSLKRFRD